MEQTNKKNDAGAIFQKVLHKTGGNEKSSGRDCYAISGSHPRVVYHLLDAATDGRKLKGNHNRNGDTGGPVSCLN
jgi:hypothetical protein